MRRLLNINNYHYHRGGAEAVYLSHGEMFAEAGWASDWFSMKHPSNPQGTDERHFAELIDLEHMHGSRDRMSAAAAIIYNSNARRRIAALLDERRPDIAHAHNIYHHLSPSILSELRRRDIPVVLTAHDLKLACPSYKMLSHGRVCERCRGGKVWNVAFHKCLKSSRALSGLIAVESTVHKLGRLYSGNISRVVAPSLFYRDKLIEWGWTADSVVYIPNFAPTHFQVSPIPAAKTILYFGRLSEEKGVATLIEAAAMSRVPVLIAGTGPEEQKLHNLAAAINAPVKFLGFQSMSSLAETLKQVRAVVLPSEWYENAPMSLLESYSAGRPVLGADIGGIPELIQTDKTGWTFPSGNVAALASQMNSIGDMPSSHLATMGQYGAQMVRERFSPARYFESMKLLYASLGVSN